MSIFDTLCGDFESHSSLIDEFLDISPGSSSLDLVGEEHHHASLAGGSLDPMTPGCNSSSHGSSSSSLGWDQDVLLSNAVLPELNPLLEMGESAEEDFQRMLNDWESHLGSIPEDSNSVEAPSELDSNLPGSEDLFDCEEPKKELLRLNSSVSEDSKDKSATQEQQKPRMTIGRKTLAGIVISSGPGGYFETYEVLEASDVDNLLEQFESKEDALLTPNSGPDPNQSSQIISAVQNHFATSTKNISTQGDTPKIVRSQRIKDALPVEIIEKIKASSQRSKTIAIIEPLTSKTARDNSGESSGAKLPKSSGIESRFKEAASNLNRNKLRQLGITQSPQRVQKVSLDHDYCSPNKPKRGRYNHSSSKENRTEQALKKRSLLLGNKQHQNKLVIGSNQVITRRDSDNKKDSGLESGDVSDASDSSSSGNKSGLYSKLPPYITTLKSSSSSAKKTFVPILEHGNNSYDRLPPYIKGIASPKKVGGSTSATTASRVEPLLKATAPKEKKKLNLVQYRHRREELLNSSHANRIKNSSVSTNESPVTIVELSENGRAEVIIEKTSSMPHSSTISTATGTTTVTGRSSIPPRQYRRNNVNSPVRPSSSSSSSSSSSASSSSSSSSDEDDYSRSRRRRQQHIRKRRRSSFSSDSHSSDSSRRGGSSSSRRRRDDSRERRRRRRSSSRSPSLSRSRSSRRRSSRDNYSVKRSKHHDQNRRDDRMHEERKVVYVGKIKEGTTRADIRKRFESFGPIEEISLHFRDRGDNYGFVTFKCRSDAFNAIEHGNDNPSLPRVDLCFGGRRTFCKAKYSDLDSVNNGESAGGYSSVDLDYDMLLKKARGELKRN
eukprot:TRINITY_DN1399_c0_g1_i2.p1 TRINITY_DN1399_c0_g1~~TRINITY_DN1399_c0_g1_i2.p1  ORF type:complete len:837 (-),score=206.20 TRINITY_DN1399_c0_g1_i2:774-3284(-)